MNRVIDLRSDTVTKPTPEMRAAMAQAEVGDDVYSEDPTVNRLEQRAAEILGKEAALFVPSGTMGNTIGIKLNTEHGQEVICDSRSHILDWELAMTAWFAGCLVRSIPTDFGLLTWEQIKPNIHSGGKNRSGTGAIEVENTHNMGGGTIYPQETLHDICGHAHDLGIRVHMDGARIFNASAASGVPVSEIAAPADTVMFCLSKGLGAPVGSMLAGDARAMAKGREHRKRLGGGMRQAGILAAAGLIALEQMPARLSEDHASARRLAEKLSKVAGLSVAAPQTNIVMIDVSATGVPAPELSSRLKKERLLMNSINPRIIRAVTHYDVSGADCDLAADIFSGVLSLVCLPMRSNPAGGLAV